MIIYYFYTRLVQISQVPALQEYRKQSPRQEVLEAVVETVSK